MATAFRATYPASRQIGELTALDGEIARRKKDHFGRRITSDYFRQLEQRVNTLAGDPGVTLDIVRDLLENSVHDAIVSSLAESYRMREDTVLDLWERRSGGSVRTSSYGDGTFILGKEKALDFGRFDAEEHGHDAEEEAEVEDFDDLVEKVKQQRAKLAAERKSASRGSALADDGPSPDEWWASAGADTRRRWIMAYYSEHSGFIHVIEAKARNCRRCNAHGTIEGTNEKGEVVEKVCPVCKGLKHERVVRAR